MGLRRIIRDWRCIVTCTLLSLAARVLSDALHIPGFYDTLGVYTAALILPLSSALVAGFTSYLVLALYYKVYLFLPWIPIVLVLLVKGLYKRFHPLVAAIPAAILYATLWFLFYAWMSNTWHYMLLYLRSRGFMILLLDSLVSFTIAYLLTKGKPRTIAGGPRWCILVAILAVITVASWGYVAWSDYFVSTWFPEHHGWLLFRTHKMDFVWLPLGAKGTNTYYYPEDRFSRGSLGYQVWVGMYWVQGYHDPRDVSLVAQFAIWDQNFWLGYHGCPKPYTYVDLVINITEYEFRGFKGYLMYGGMVSRSDVSPYEEVKLRGFFITFYDPRTDHTAIIYACATEENFKKMLPKLWEIVKSWEKR